MFNSFWLKYRVRLRSNDTVWSKPCTLMGSKGNMIIKVSGFKPWSSKDQSKCCLTFALPRIKVKGLWSQRLLYLLSCQFVLYKVWFRPVWPILKQRMVVFFFLSTSQRSCLLAVLSLCVLWLQLCSGELVGLPVSSSLWYSIVMSI